MSRRLGSATVRVKEFFMQLLQSLFGSPSAYVALQRFVAPEKEERLRQVLEDHRAEDAVPMRVLDLGCGPGTNAGLFACRERYRYVGIDSNFSYIATAIKRYGLDFRHGDITNLQNVSDCYDLALLNSVLHHLDDVRTKEAISTAASHVKRDGRLVVLDQIAPERRSLSTVIQRYLIDLDRGNYTRDARALYDVLAGHFPSIEYSRFATTFLGIRLWDWELYVCQGPKSLPINGGQP
jgi:SAM-dependent methyltransferase